MMKTLKLSETKGMLKRIAEAKIKTDGKYLCIIAGKKTMIVA